MAPSKMENQNVNQKYVLWGSKELESSTFFVSICMFCTGLFGKRFSAEGGSLQAHLVLWSVPKRPSKGGGAAGAPTNTAINGLRAGRLGKHCSGWLQGRGAE